MRSILNIAVHHAGGIASDLLASSLHMTPAAISAAHKSRWNFPSQYMKDPQGQFWYGGYNCIYDPKDRTFTQFRAIGEETAAQYGFNFNTFSLCIIGNYMTKPGSWPRASVDPLTDQIVEDITLFLHDLIDGNKRDLFVVPGTSISLAIGRVHPHRFYQQTECYGSFMPDSFFQDQLITYKPVVVPQPATPENPTPTDTITLEKRNVLIQLYLQLVAALNQIILNMQKKQVRGLGSVGGRSCECVYQNSYMV